MNMIEMQFLNALQLIRTSAGDFLMPLVSDSIALLMILPVLLLLRRSTRKAGLVILAALVLDYFTCNLFLKNLFRRVRPCDVNTAVTLLVPRPEDYSFPSGHTALSFAAASGLWFSGALKKWRAPVLLLACLIAFSRLYLYLHYPTDILAGAAVGVLCGWIASRICQGADWKRRLRKEAAV